MYSMIACLLVAGAEALAGPAPAKNAELDAYLAEAFAKHPALAQRHAEWLAALERVPQVTSLDDPIFSYGQFLQSETQRAKISVVQKFPWFGTLRARGDQAAAQADAAQSRALAERDAVAFMVERSYLDYALLAERIAIVEAQSELLDYVGEIVEVKLSFGMATDDELLRVSIASIELDDRHTSLLEMRTALSYQLSAALGRREHDLLPWPTDDALPPSAPESTRITTRIRSANPNLHVLEHRLDALEIQETLARKRGRPDISLGLDWTAISKPRQIRPERPYPATLNAASRTLSTLSGDMPFVARNSLIDAYSLSTADEPFVDSDGGDDNLMISLSFNIPLWRKKVRAGINEARHLQAAAEREHEALALDLARSAELLRFAMVDAERRYHLFDDALLPQAKLSFESLQAQYAADVGDASFIDLLGAVQQILDFELEQVQTRTQWQQAWAELKMLMGGVGTDLAMEIEETEAITIRRP